MTGRGPLSRFERQEEHASEMTLKPFRTSVKEAQDVDGVRHGNAIERKVEFYEGRSEGDTAGPEIHQRQEAERMNDMEQGATVGDWVRCMSVFGWDVFGLRKTCRRQQHYPSSMCTLRRGE